MLEVVFSSTVVRGTRTFATLVLSLLSLPEAGAVELTLLKWAGVSVAFGSCAYREPAQRDDRAVCRLPHVLVDLLVTVAMAVAVAVAFLVWREDVVVVGVHGCVVQYHQRLLLPPLPLLVGLGTLAQREPQVHRSE